MTVEIEIPDQQAAILKVHAEARGLTLEQLLLQLAEEVAPIIDPSASSDQESLQTPERPIWEVIVERMNALPPEVFEGLPEDGASQHDHYIYGLPKREP